MWRTIRRHALRGAAAACAVAAPARLAARCIAEEKPPLPDLAPEGNEDLRRFDTLAPPDAAGMPLAPAAAAAADDSAAAAIAEGEQQAQAAALLLAEQTAELTAKIARLRAELDARSAVDDEAWRVQQAVQRQEEADSMKMLALLREQDDAFASQLEQAKADVEAAVLRRMRDEQASLEAEYMEAMGQLKARSLRWSGSSRP